MSKEAREAIKRVETLENVDIKKLQSEAKMIRRSAFWSDIGLIEKDLDRLDELEAKEVQRNEDISKVLDIAQFGQLDGDHHKLWVIDQIVRALTKDGYDAWVKSYMTDEDTGRIEWIWDIGIAP